MQEPFGIEKPDSLYGNLCLNLLTMQKKMALFTLNADLHFRIMQQKINNKKKIRLIFQSEYSSIYIFPVLCSDHNKLSLH